MTGRSRAPRAGVARLSTATARPSTGTTRSTTATAHVSTVPPPSRRRRAPVPRGSSLGAPDVRDGLTRIERIVLWQLDGLQRELGDRGVPTAMLHGRVLEHVDVTEDELVGVLQRLLGVKTRR